MALLSRKSEKVSCFSFTKIKEGEPCMPCPHYDIKIIQRSNHQSAVASAAYQSGDRLFSEYDQKQKYYSHKSEIIHKEILLPSHAPPEYADRNTLWNAAEAVEKQWNSQLIRTRITHLRSTHCRLIGHLQAIRHVARKANVENGISLTISPIRRTASMLIPVLVEPTLTELQTKSVCAIA